MPARRCYREQKPADRVRPAALRGINQAMGVGNHELRPAFVSTLCDALSLGDRGSIVVYNQQFAALGP